MTRPSTFGEKVTKSNFQSVLSWRKRAGRDGGEKQGKSVPTASLSKPSSPAPLPWTNLHQDWGEAIDVSVFYGRTEELTTLKQWIVPDAPAKIFPEPCRLVLLLGVGGIGKTVLAVKLARQLVAEPGDRKDTETRCMGDSPSRPYRDTGNSQNSSPHLPISPSPHPRRSPIPPSPHSPIPPPPFQSLIWRSLRNAPLPEEILADLSQFLSSQPDTDDNPYGDAARTRIAPLPETINGQISQLIKYLRAHRCLLILDDAAAILQSGDSAGHYRAGYEGYGQLLRCVGETAHQSCLVLISREEPIGLAAKAGKTSPIQSLQLAGLQEAGGRSIFRAKGLLELEEQWLALIQYFRGHPLALKIVATTIQKVFDGNPAKFLEQGTFVFGDIRHLLEQHFNRLSALEKQVMYWLAVHQAPVSPAKLHKNIVLPASHPQLLEALESLQRRSLIEKNAADFTQQPMVMDYVTEKLVEQVCQAITTEELTSLIRHALIRAWAKDLSEKGRLVSLKENDQGPISSSLDGSV